MTHTITCEAFEARLADWLEGALDPARHAEMDAHAASCDRCGALARDLRAIARDAAALPALAPSRDLWDGIAARIEPSVVPLAPAGAPRSGRNAHRIPRWGLAAAAAVLVALSSVLSYNVAMRRAEARYAARGTAPATALPAPAGPGRDSEPVSIATREASAPEILAAPVTPDGVRSGSAAASPATGRATVAPVRLASASASAPYDREIARLRLVVEARRGELDSATVAVIEKNLRVIDDAIAQSRAALARDPRSGFLIEQLNEALDRKVELLRTAALLPVRS